jgi:Icc protein
MHRSLSLSQRHKERIDLLQFTDTHICPGPAQSFDGVDTEKTLQQVIAHARHNHWPPDAILVTGDLVHEPAPAAYERLFAILKTIERPMFFIPGNHDDPSLMRRHLETDNLSTASSIIFDRWIIVMLDSFLPGTHAGCLSNTELGYLDLALMEHRDKHALICLHHPPVSVGSPWMDRMGLQNPADLFSITDRHPQVQGMLCGHIHQEFKCARNTVQIMTSPSTCVQFTPCNEGYIRDVSPPGYRHVQLFDTGEIRTGIARIE